MKHTNKRKRRLKSITLGIVMLLIVSAAAIYVCDKIIKKAATGKTYSSTVDIPFNRTGLLLGTSKYLPNGFINPYYAYRMAAAIELKKSRKINYLVVSGDNNRQEYNEPETMRSDLMDAGIDSTSIYLDYAGFRTFDSMVRLREIFGQDSVTIISQQFHNERALYIAGREKIEAIGFNARDVEAQSGLRVQVREKFARVKVFLDYILGKKPKFLGEKIIIS